MILGHEMSNSYIILVIEKKLPEERRWIWVKYIAEKGEVDCEKVFQLLLKFLKRWRNIIKYNESAIRKFLEKRVASTHYTQRQRVQQKTNPRKHVGSMKM